MTQLKNRLWLISSLVSAACAPTTQPSSTSSELAKPPLMASVSAGTASHDHGAVGLAGAAAVAPVVQPTTPPASVPPAPSERPPAAAGNAAPAVPPPPAGAGRAAPPMAAGAAAPIAPGSSSGNAAADAFCDKYGMYCGYAKPMRHADRAACEADFVATPAQQGCKVMHLDTAIAGTAAACNGMASEFCFSIHCLHAAGLTDPTGTTYCK